MRKSFRLSRVAAAALSLLLLAAIAPAASAEPARHVPAPVLDASGGKRIVIPDDWRRYYPFSARYAAAEAGTGRERVIDLAATRFATERLATTTKSGRREFAAPDASAFPADLIRPPFEREGADLFILQASSAAAQRMLARALTGRGVKILGYLPDTAYLVRLTPAELRRFSRHSAVFWAGLFQPAWRIDPKLDYVIEADAAHRVKMQALFDPASYESRAALVAAVSGAGLRVADATRRSADWKVLAEGPAGAARALATLAGSLWIERFTDLHLDNNIARTSLSVPTGRGILDGPIMDVESVWARGIHGEGQIAAASDTGLSTGDLATLHWDFGQQGSAANPMRVVNTYTIGRPGDWSDNQAQGGGHGTHTSGSIVGNGVRSGADPSTNSFPGASYAGIAPKAGFVFQSIMNAAGGLVVPADLNNLFLPPYNDGARVHSNSWGTSQFGQYTTASQEVDQFSWDHKDMVITYSAGNAGVDGRRFNAVTRLCNLTGDPIDGVIDTNSIGAPATAKNCISIGASENYRPEFVYEAPQGACASPDGIVRRTWGWFNSCNFSLDPIFSDLIADNANGVVPFSSRGPTLDGRIKPDLVAPGSAVISTRTDMNQAYQQWGVCAIPPALRTFYLADGGTSMANPLTAGAAVLVRQFYSDGWHPNNSLVTNPAPNAVDGFNPSSALVKATLINGAWDMTPGQYGGGPTQELPPGWDAGQDLPNNAEGYGRVDLQGALFTGSGFGQHPARNLEIHDVNPGLQTASEQKFPFSIALATDQLTVTLVWTDPFAAAGAGVKLVNDLDLTVTAPDGTVYFPNGINRLAGADRRNNVEQARITTPLPGGWTARVTGFNVPGNGVPGTDTQPFALVISGVLHFCGNDTAEAPEVCDGTDLSGQTCVSLGFAGGTLACAASCRQFDTSGCF